MKKGRAGTMTHDYKRHGTTTLFAALDVATGKVIGACMKRHRHQEWLEFLKLKFLKLKFLKLKFLNSSTAARPRTSTRT